MSKTIRQIIITVVIMVIGIVGFNLLKGQKKTEDRRTDKAIPFVKTLLVTNGEVPSVISVTGRLVAREKISVIAEVMGTLKESPKVFKEGVAYSSGETMLSIDANEFRMNLLAQKSAFLNLLTQMMPDLKIDYSSSADKWDKYIKGFEIEKPLVALPEADGQEKYFLSSRNVYQQYYAIKSLEERLGKYNITAPFNGTVTVSNVYPGMTIPAGQMLGEFLNPNSFEIETAVTAGDIRHIKVGDAVKLTSTELGKSWDGKVARMSDKIDPATQSVKVFVSVQGNGLREGLYLSGEIKSGAFENAFEVPRRLLVDDNHLYLVNDTVLTRKEVEILRVNRGTVVVKGLSDNSALLDESMPGAYEGMLVKVKRENEVVTSN